MYGNSFKLSQPACIKYNCVYVPAKDVLEKFGFVAEFYQNTNELFIYPGDVDWLVDNASKRSVISQYILEKDKELYISQKEAEIESSGVRIKAKAVKDGLTDNYIAEIYKRDIANKSLSEELEKLKTEIEDNQKIIENLYQQISSLKEQLKK